jgi:hypothetical protein
VTDSHLNYRLRTVNPDIFNYPATNIWADIVSWMLFYFEATMQH